MEHFAGYGFNKSHSTAYAFLAYQTAYLKANYPVALRRGAADHRSAEHRQARAVPRRVPRARHPGAAARHQREPAAVHGRAGQGRPLRPDRDQERRRRRDRVAARRARRSRGASRRCTRSARISISGWSTSACSRAWSRPARSIRSRERYPALTRPAVGGAAAAAPRRHRRGVRARRAASARPRRGPGAAVRRVRRRDDGRHERRRDGFAASLPQATPWTETEQLGFEKETLGLYWSGHPVDRYAAELKSFGARSTGELADAPVTGSRGDAWGPGGPKPIEPDTSIGGIIAACRQLKTRKGDRMAVFTLEDAQGGVEVIAFPEAYQRARQPDRDRDAWCSSGASSNATTSRCGSWRRRSCRSTRVRERLAREVAIRVRMPADRGVFEALGEVFSRHRGDRRVSFEIELPVGADAAARQGGRLVADPRPAVVDADRRGRADRRAGSGLAAMT